jgi:choloylglycine hydrolase
MNSIKKHMVVFLYIFFSAGCSLLSTSKTSQPIPLSLESPVSPESEVGSWSGAEVVDAETATLNSLQLVDPYPLYTMSYYAPYEHFSETLKPPASVQGELAWGCSLFAALGDTGNLLFGRNFDWSYSPALLLFTLPSDGYASASMVNLEFLGHPGERGLSLVEQPIEELDFLLSAPYLPIDGVNEMGLAVGMAAVPGENIKPDPGKRSIGSLGIIRELLDHAADVSDAVDIMETYNIDFSGGPQIHYLIADRFGNAVLVEYQGDDTIIIPNAKTWHQATNFTLSSIEAEPSGRCHRYDTLNQRLTASQGKLDPEEGMALLADVSQESTQWSVLYHLSTGEIQVVIGQDYAKSYRFNVKSGEK